MTQWCHFEESRARLAKFRTLYSITSSRRIRTRPGHSARSPRWPRSILQLSTFRITCPATSMLIANQSGRKQPCWPQLLRRSHCLPDCGHTSISRPPSLGKMARTPSSNYNLLSIKSKSMTVRPRKPPMRMGRRKLKLNLTLTSPMTASTARALTSSIKSK